MIGPLITRFASRLRFPALFTLVAVLFVVDVLIPDVVPFFDEVMLALGTLLLGSLRKRRPDADATQASSPAKSNS